MLLAFNAFMQSAYCSYKSDIYACIKYILKHAVISRMRNICAADKAPAICHIVKTILAPTVNRNHRQFPYSKPKYPNNSECNVSSIVCEYNTTPTTHHTRYEVCLKSILRWQAIRVIVDTPYVSLYYSSHRYVWYETQRYIELIFQVIHFCIYQLGVVHR